MFSNQATSGLGSGNPVAVPDEVFAELVNDVKRQLEEKRLKSLVSASNDGLKSTDSKELREQPSEHAFQVGTGTPSSNASVPSFVPSGVNGDSCESSRIPEKASVPPTSPEMNSKAFLPTAPSFLPPFEVNPFFLALPGLGNPAASLSSATGTGTQNPTTSTACAPSLPSFLGWNNSALLSATRVESSQPITSANCVPSLESLLAGMNNFGTMPALQNTAIVLTEESSTNCQRLPESPLRKIPKLFHHAETVPTSLVPFEAHGSVIPQNFLVSTPIPACDFQKFLSTAFQNSGFVSNMGDGLLQPNASASCIFGEMPILKKSSLVSEIASVLSEPVTPAVIDDLKSKSSDPNTFEKMPILERSVLASEPAPLSSGSKTSDSSVLFASKEVGPPMKPESAQPTTAACPPLAPIPTEPNIFGGMSILGNSALLDKIAKLSSQPAESTATVPPAASAANTKVPGTISVSEKSALLSSKSDQLSKLLTSTAQVPLAPKEPDTNTSGTIPNLESSVLSSSVTNVSLPSAISASDASHVSMPDINIFGTMSILENPALLSAIANLSSKPPTTAASATLAPMEVGKNALGTNSVIDNSTQLSGIYPTTSNSAKSTGIAPLAPSKVDTSVLTTTPVSYNSALGVPLVSLPTDTNIFDKMSIFESSALLSAMANLSSQPPASDSFAPLAPTEIGSSVVLAEKVPGSLEPIPPIAANSSIFPSMPILDNSTLQAALKILQQLQQTSNSEMPALGNMNVPSTSEGHADGKQPHIAQQTDPLTERPYASYALANLTALANSFNGFPDKSPQFYSSLPPTPSISQQKKRNRNRNRGSQNNMKPHTTKPYTSRPPTVLDMLAANHKSVQPILNGNIYPSWPSNRHVNKPMKNQEQSKSIPLIDLTIESDQTSRTPPTTLPIWFDSAQIIQPGSPFIEKPNVKGPSFKQLVPERQVNIHPDPQVSKFLKEEFGIVAVRNDEKKESEEPDTSLFLNIPDVDTNTENYYYTMTGRIHPSNKSRTPPINFKQLLLVVEIECCSPEELMEIINSFPPNEQRYLKHCGQYSQWRYETNLKCFQDFHRDFMYTRFVLLISNKNCHEDMLRLEEKFRFMKELTTKDLDENYKAKFCSTVMIDAATMNNTFNQNCKLFPMHQVFSCYNIAIVNRSLEPVMKHPKVDLPTYHVMHKTIDDAFKIVSAEVTGISEEQMNELYKFFKKDWAITGEVFEQLQSLSGKPQIPGLIAGAIFDKIRDEIQKVITKNNYWWYLDNQPPMFD